MDTVKRGKATPKNADFAVKLTGQELSPYAEKGSVVYFERCAEFSDGEVGLFLVGEKSIIRQYCEDSEGNIYLFSVNRRLKRLDIRLKKGAKVYAFGKLLLPSPVPLPEI